MPRPRPAVEVGPKLNALPGTMLLDVFNEIAGDSDGGATFEPVDWLGLRSTYDWKPCIEVGGCCSGCADDGAGSGATAFFFLRVRFGLVSAGAIGAGVTWACC